MPCEEIARFADCYLRSDQRLLKCTQMGAMQSVLNIHRYATGSKALVFDKFLLKHHPTRSILGIILSAYETSIERFTTLFPGYWAEFGFGCSIERVERPSVDGLGKLSPIEHEVAFLLAVGFDAEAIAQVLPRLRPGSSADVDAALFGIAEKAAMAGVPMAGLRPALILDRAALERNIKKMAATAEQHSIGLRPHVKSHKCARIAHQQIDAGALGVSCATLGEAEAMVEAGIPGVLITSPVVSTNKMRRLVALAEKAGPRQLMVVVDDPRNVAELPVHAARLAYPLDVLIDYHSGYYRTGVVDEEDALVLARVIVGSGSLQLRGLQAYGGHLQHIAGRAQRDHAAEQLRDAVAQLVHALTAAGMPIEIVTGVGTGTHLADADAGVFTEMQPGSYLFMDVEYQQVLADDTSTPPFETSLFVQSTVVSTHADSWVTVDTGTKSFATDSGVPVVARGVEGPSQYAFFGDEHGKLIVAAEHRPSLGAHIEFVTPHCDPTVNLYDRYHVVEGDVLVDIWPIEARGRL